MKLKICFGAIFLSFCVLASCSKGNQVVVLEGGTMGTTYRVKYVPLGPIDPANLQKEIEAILQKVNKQMSTYDKGSEITQVNKRYKGEPTKVSTWFAQVLTYSLGLAKKTNGVFDPTLGPLVNLWGFGPGGQRKVPSKKEIQSVLPYVGYKKVEIKPQRGNWFFSKTHNKVYVDLSATAKGFGVDKVSEHLSLKGIVNHLVDIGGEIKVKGRKSSHQPWRVAIEKPDETAHRSVQVSFALADYSLATSGNYRNFFKENGAKYSHTIDAKTGRPVRHRLLSVSILHKSCMEADGLATALMALGPQKAWLYALKNKLAAYLIIAPKSPKSKAFRIKKTPSFKQIAKIK